MDAEGGDRTHTPFRAPDFESGASASSATSASADRSPADAVCVRPPGPGYCGTTHDQRLGGMPTVRRLTIAALAAASALSLVVAGCGGSDESSSGGGDTTT